MTFTDFLTFTDNLFPTLCRSFESIVTKFSTPIINDLNNLFPYDPNDPTVIGSLLHNLVNGIGEIIGTDLTYFGLMFGVGLGIFVTVTFIKWIISIFK